MEAYPSQISSVTASVFSLSPMYTPPASSQPGRSFYCLFRQVTGKHHRKIYLHWNYSQLFHGAFIRDLRSYGFRTGTAKDVDLTAATKVYDAGQNSKVSGYFPWLADLVPNSDIRYRGSISFIALMLQCLLSSWERLSERPSLSFWGDTSFERPLAAGPASAQSWTRWTGR